jgi:CheY-like chemotaxis protein
VESGIEKIEGTEAMSTYNACPFYRSAQTLGPGTGDVYCDLTGEPVRCEGDIPRCEKEGVWKNSSPVQKENEARREAEKDPAKFPPRYRVLVVDDEESLVKVVGAVFTRLGHQYVSAAHGVDALNRFGQGRFDAVVTDIVMPHMDGITLTRELLKQAPGLPIMVMTGYSKEYPTETALKSGAREFIGKPFSLLEFALRFNKMMADQELSARIESRQREMLLQARRKSEAETKELRKEIEKVTSRLMTGYGRFGRP